MGNIAYTSKGDEIYAIYLPDAADDANILPLYLHIPCQQAVHKVIFNGREVPFSQESNGIAVSVKGAFEMESAYVFTLK